MSDKMIGNGLAVASALLFIKVVMESHTFGGEFWHGLFLTVLGCLSLGGLFVGGLLSGIGAGLHSEDELL